jgi:hypothetical protein
VLIVSVIYSVFRNTGRNRARHPIHVTISTAVLVTLSLINFGVVFAFAWKGDAGLNSVIFICGMSFCANFYAAWNQLKMVWKGGLILCGWVLLFAFGSVFEDDAAQLFVFWFSRAAAVYVSALAGEFSLDLFPHRSVAHRTNQGFQKEAETHSHTVSKGSLYGQERTS